MIFLAFFFSIFLHIWGHIAPTALFSPDNEESLRSGRDKSFPIKNIPALKTRNNKAATKQKKADWCDLLFIFRRLGGKG